MDFHTSIYNAHDDTTSDVLMDLKEDATTYEHASRTRCTYQQLSRSW